MSDLIATLQCPKCGGKLAPVPGTQRYRCDYCGNEHIVRRDGLIYYGPDKIASEAAMKRLTAEIAEAETAVQNALAAWDQAQAQLRAEKSAIEKAETRL